MKRTLVIGDIHGSAKALEQCLKRAGVGVGDKIIQLGDVADGWPETSECVDILLDLQKTNECIFLRGNHDCGVFDWLFKYESLPIWTSQGGDETIKSYLRTEKHLTDEHLYFWKNQEDWYIDNENRLFIHAGWFYIDKKVGWPKELSPLELFELQASIPYGWGSMSKACHWDRDIWYGSKSGAVKNGKTGEPTGFNPLKIFNEIYIGHTALYPVWHNLPPQPKNNLNLWNLDTGCGWGGVLTIMDIGTKEYWQSDLSSSLYPNMKGR